LVNISQEGQASKQLISINLLYTNSGVNVGVAKYNSSQTLQSKAFFSSGNGASLTVDGATTYLIVGKYAWVTPGTSDDAVTVWVNPGNLGASEDPGNKVSTSAGTDGTSGCMPTLTNCASAPLGGCDPNRQPKLPPFHQPKPE
jgi:hypothetical protein